MSLGFSGDENRRLYDSSFEPYGSGFVFYRHAWSRGVPVTAEEREASLQPPFFSSRLALLREIRGRPAATPRRSWLLVQRRMAAALPASFVPSMLAASVVVILHGWSQGPEALRWAEIGFGLFIAAYVATILLLRSRG